MIVFACMLILLWLLVSQIKTQRALQWWYSRQTTQLFQAAEGIRNGLLQEAFTLRRSLELSLATTTHTPETADQDCLTAIEHFHHDLKELSDQLSPPYIDDSLPLAIQSVLEEWKGQRPFCQIKWDLPSIWQPEPYDRSHLILTALDELLRLILVSPEFKSEIAVHLQQTDAKGELSIQFVAIDRGLLTNPKTVRELQYLKQAFRVLSFGECFCRPCKQTITWYFRWQLSSSNHH